MKSCRLCKQPKSYHVNKWLGGPDHKFELDNLDFLNRKFEAKLKEEKHRRLNYCQICRLIKKSPFGLCKECSEMSIRLYCDPVKELSKGQ